MSAAAASGQADTPVGIAEIVTTHCIECHAGETAWAGIRMDSVVSTPDAPSVSDMHTAIVDRLQDRTMPPADRPDMPDDERAALVQWISDRMQEVPAPAATDIDPGWFASRRLTRTEYANTLRDVLGVDPASLDIEFLLPQDDLGHGFDNNADVLSVSPLHIEGYLEVAERALEQALGPAVAVDTRFRSIVPLAISRGGRSLPDGGIYLTSQGAAIADQNISQPGLYKLRITAWGTRGGDELPHLEVRVAGESIGGHEVESTERSAPDVYETTVTLQPGPQQIEALFTNDYYEKGVADRNLAVGSIEIAGPMFVDPASRPPLYLELFGAVSPATATEKRAAVSHAIAVLAERAYRRQLDGGTLASLVGVFERSRMEGVGYERAARDALTAMLVSPEFLFLTPDSPASETPTPIGPYSTASRLSYFLWSSAPDAELLRLARHGLLTGDAMLRTQVARMLADPRAEAFYEGFAGQWLLLRNLERVDIDPGLYPSYSVQLREDLEQEVIMTFEHAVRANRPPLDLISSDTVFVNQRLAEHYGLPEQFGDGLRPVRLEPGTPRGGILTAGAVLTLTSNPTRTSPVKRGLYVLDQILGAPPPPPPPDVPPLTNAASDTTGVTSTRELLALHVADPACASCHMRMDPIGLALENFDAIGRWRDTMYDEPIDASGTLPSGETFRGADGLRDVLLAREDQFQRHLADRLLTYAIGRGLERSDERSLDLILEEFHDRGGGLADLIEAVVLSPAFLMHRTRVEHPADSP